MSASVSQLVQAALLLPQEDRTKLVEAILERSGPSDDQISRQMETVRRRMENVAAGRSILISAEDAHRTVREALTAEA